MYRLLPKMKILFVFALALGLFASCNNDSETPQTKGDLEINFLSTYDGDPLVMNNTFPYDAGQQIRFNTSRFFMSDFMMDGATVDVILNDIMELNFTDVNSTLEGAEQGITYTFKDIPEGTYASLSFGIGVSADLNAMNPADFPSDHPLRQESEYWNAWNSYIFNKIEGKLDTVGGGDFDIIYVYHSGKDELYFEHEKDFSIKIEGGKTTKINFTVDHKDLLYRGGQALDIKSKPTAHSAGDLAYPRYILENFENAVKLQNR